MLQVLRPLHTRVSLKGYSGVSLAVLILPHFIVCVVLLPKHCLIKVGFPPNVLWQREFTKCCKVQARVDDEREWLTARARVAFCCRWNPVLFTQWCLLAGAAAMLHDFCAIFIRFEKWATKNFNTAFGGGGGCGGGGLCLPLELQCSFRVLI